MNALLSSNLRARLIRSLVILATLFTGSRAEAMPNWARKYGVSCSTCHTTIPALNEVGYNFRKAGFRMPSEIYTWKGVKEDPSAPEKTTLENSYAARIQVNYANTHSDTGVPANDSSTAQLQYFETTLYPISNSFGKHMASLMELSFAPGDALEVENAYVRYTAGQADHWFTARMGVFHPFEGYGASDRPFSLDRPFIQGTPASGAYFKPWGFDETGVEVAYVYKRSTLSFTVFNGILVQEEDGSLISDPAQGGHLSKKVGFKNYNTKDFQVFFNQILSDNGSGISAYYYSGRLDQPIPGTLPGDFAPATSFENKFDREALYASWVFMPAAQLRAGYQVGNDNSSTGVKFKSKGYFGEIASSINEHLTVGARYDRFQPTDLVSQVDKTGYTAYANIPFNDGWQMIAQYQHVNTDQGVSAVAKKDDKFQIRFIWIF